MALLSKERETDRGPARSEGPSDLSVILKDVRILGDVESEGRMRIEGSVTGSVRARGLELAAGGTIEGDVTALGSGDSKESFVIDGEVKGSVRAGQVQVGQHGSVQGGIEATQAAVRGRVIGGIQARDRLALKSTAVVEGDIETRRLSLEEGGQVNGNIRIADRATLKSVPGHEGAEAPTTDLPKARASA